MRNEEQGTNKGLARMYEEQGTNKGLARMYEEQGMRYEEQVKIINNC